MREVKSGATNDFSFRVSALKLWVHQMAHNEPYNRFCEGRGKQITDNLSWRDIPAAPAAAFKRFALTCAPEAECTTERGGRVFHSSGTTGDQTSRHFMDATALDAYRLSLREGFRRFVMPDSARLPIFALMPPQDEMPHSSLSFMLAELIADYGGGFFWNDSLQERLAAALDSAVEPVTLFGTAFAWVHFFDVPGNRRWSLPAGSRIIETGGFKGRSREVSRDELYALFTARIGVPSTHCISEYGMSEMASQFYDSTLHDFVNGIVRPPRKIGPPWLKTRAVDPLTNADAAPGQPGLLVHYDLANLNSVIAIQTEDLGILAEDGDGFTLLGRAPGAILRGCSLTAEEFAGKRL